MEIKIKILIVEDSQPARDRLLTIITSPPEAWLTGIGYAAFEADGVATAQEARDKLDRALAENRPYEVVLLDLHIPEDGAEPGGYGASEEIGRKLLAEIRSRLNAAVVVLTGYPSTENLIHSVQRGAADFIIKPLADREAERMLFIRLIKAVGAARERAHRELTGQRLYKHALVAERASRLDLSRRISEKLEVAVFHLERVAKVLEQQYGLDLQRDDTSSATGGIGALHGDLDGLKQCLIETPRLESVPMADGSVPRIDVGQVFEEVIAQVRPCFLHQGVRLMPSTGKGLETTSIESDLAEMVKEMMLGALDATQGQGEVIANASRAGGRRDIVVSVSYDGPPVSEAVKDALHSGEIPSGELKQIDQTYWFLWSVARNVGVRITAEKGEKLASIELRIPVIDE